MREVIKIEEENREEKVKRLVSALKRIAVKREVVFHERNGEEMVHEDIYDLIQAVITERRPDYEFTDQHDNAGYFHNDVYLINQFVILVSIWNNAPGYCWGETIVEVFKL